MKKVYIALSFDDRKELSEEISIIKDVLVAKKYEPLVFVNDFVFSARDSEKEMMDSACSEIRDADILIAEVSHKAIGVGLEIGYAKALGKKIVYVRRVGSEYSKTIGGVSDEMIVYKDVFDLKTQLQKIF